MCGIFFSCSQQNDLPPSSGVLDCLKRRGPDDQQGVQLRLEVPKYAGSTLMHIFHLTLISTVLSLRGNEVVRQPLEDPLSGSLLCWNGEVWKIDGAIFGGNDVQPIFGLLLEATTHNTVGHDDRSIAYAKTLQAVINVITRLSGPYAFVFYDARHQRIFYGRDILGRRSLLYKNAEDGSLTVSSICDGSVSDAWSEVEANGIYVLDLAIARTDNENEGYVLKHIAWSKEEDGSALCPCLRSPFPELNKESSTIRPPLLQLDSSAVTELTQKLLLSMSPRVKHIPILPGDTQNSARIAILFSGGLDCTVLARLVHNLLPEECEVDLLNVAFENPRVIKAAGTNASQLDSSASSPYSVCPDRKTGLSSHAELLRVCPGRTWRFIGIDVPYSETLARRAQIISLIHPHNTEMDLSIACALYFAARGRGMVCNSVTGAIVPYVTPARVLLSGLGADELFAGYTRHAIAFNRRGYQGLLAELELDFMRLGKRNLGRDDRVISHWGREARYPYLDEDLVTWALERRVWEKCGFGESVFSETGLAGDDGPVLEPGKKILRLVAWKLGMENVAIEKKRAIQFGARTAKMGFGRVKGTDRIS